MKKCNVCNKYLFLEDFHKNPKHPQEHHRTCKNCRKIETKERYKKYTDKINQQTLAYNKTHKIYRRIAVENYRCKKLGLTTKVSYDSWRSILYQQNFKCAKCKGKRKLEMDHIIPILKGGQHTVSNIQALCKPCNVRKGAYYDGSK